MSKQSLVKLRQDPFISCRGGLIDPYATDWESLDPAFKGMPGRLNYADFDSDYRQVTGVYLDHEDRIDKKLSEIRECDSIFWEMTSYLFRLYIDRGIYVPLLRDVNKECRIPYSPTLIWLHDGLLRAKEVRLLERLWRGQTRLEISRIIGGWREQDARRKAGDNTPSGEEVHGARIEELATGWFDHAIKLFRELGEPEMAEWFAIEREALVTRSFLKPKDLPKPEKLKIDDESFWKILADVQAESDGDESLRTVALASRLEKLSGPSIRSFARRYEKIGKSFARHDVTALLLFVYGIDSADFYFDFCEEIIWRGDRELAEGLLSKPLDVSDRFPSSEHVLFTTPLSEAIDEASVARTGEVISWSDAMVNWRGRRWIFEKINQQYPLLAEHFGKVAIEAEN